MTYEDALIVLTTMKAAYPKDYPYNMSVKDAEITATVWAEQFKDIPGAIVKIAVKQLVSREEKCFSIAKVKKQIGSMYWEAKDVLDREVSIKRFGGRILSREEKALYENIKRICAPYKYSKAVDLPIADISGKAEILLLGGDTDG